MKQGGKKEDSFMSYCEIAVPGVRIIEDPGNGEILEVVNPLASARIALRGGKVLSFIPAGGEDILGGGTSPDVSSHCGVPVCWPWFGGADVPSHGFVRDADWEVVLIETAAGGAHHVVLAVDPLRCDDPRGKCFDFDLQLSVVVGSSLELSLSMRNRMDHPVKIGCALHTYFRVSDISAVEIHGLDAVEYLDYTAAGGRQRCVQSGAIRFSGEVDWVFCPSRGTVELVDSGWGRVIRVEKSGSASTVVWNPGAEVAEKMADLAGGGYRRMVCIEAANAMDDVRSIDPGVMHTLMQKISWKKLGI